MAALRGEERRQPGALEPPRHARVPRAHAPDLDTGDLLGVGAARAIRDHAQRAHAEARGHAARQSEQSLRGSEQRGEDVVVARQVQRHATSRTGAGAATPPRTNPTTVPAAITVQVTSEWSARRGLFLRTASSANNASHTIAQ